MPTPANTAARDPAGAAGARRVRRNSRLVWGMKIGLPLAAAALVAVLFLDVPDSGDLAELFASGDMAALGAGLKVENPRFGGVTSQGESYTVEADWALPDSAKPTVIELVRPHGAINLEDGRKLTGRSLGGRLLRRENLLVLEGEVVLDRSDGYRLETALMQINLKSNAAEAPGAVTGFGPGGRIEAGSLRVIAGDDPDQPGKIWFENRVRLVLIPADEQN